MRGLDSKKTFYEVFQDGERRNHGALKWKKKYIYMNLNFQISVQTN